MKPDTIPKPLPADFPKTPAEWERVIAAAPETIHDPDCPYDPNDAGAVQAFWKDAVVSRSLPELREKLAARRRGPQRAPLKVPTTIRFDAAVLTGLRATGRGWQTRVNEVMKNWLKSHTPV